MKKRCYKNLIIVKLPIDNEAAIDVKDNKGLTALCYDEREGSVGAAASGAERRGLGVQGQGWLDGAIVCSGRLGKIQGTLPDVLIYGTMSGLR
jgi:hypothetical protein